MPNDDVARQVRASYEQLPYPAVTRAALRRPRWQLPPPDWIGAVAQPEHTPRRILIAGCGTGLEAFAFHRRFPKAEIVGVDFAARSIRLARNLQQRAAPRGDLRFLRADLTSDRLLRQTGGEFDFISCHGVVSYLPAVERALGNLADCLTKTGILYLGVNGPLHFSEGWRKFLPAFGFDMARWPGGGHRLWRHLKLAACLADDGRGDVLRHGPRYLGSDLFGSLIRNLPLAEWTRMCRDAGLHLRGCHGIQRLLWPAINDGSYPLFLPRSRGEIAELLDALHPSGFYRLVFTRQPEPAPPWQNKAALLRWYPRRTPCFRHFQWKTGSRARVLKLESRSANISIELRGGGWEAGLLRASDGTRSIGELLGLNKKRVTPAALRSQLYLFYLFDLLNFLPPMPRWEISGERTPHRGRSAAPG